MDKLLFTQLKLVIFDVDGTLYDQKQLRFKMLFAILSYYVIRPWRFKELVFLYNFRKEREKRSGFKVKNLEEAQYQWCLSKTSLTTTQMKKVVDKWMFEFPNQFLKRYMYPGLHLFFEELQKNKILTAIYSDYPAHKKLVAMDLKADLTICSTDPEIDALKPEPDGLLYILEQLGIEQKSSCLFIGDREDLDGVCAQKAGVPFLLLDGRMSGKNFYQILSEKIRST